LVLVEAAIAAGTSLVDLVGEAPVKRRALDGEARRAGCLVVPGCGVAPGISNFCVGRGIELLDETDKAAIYVGGIPKTPKPPLFYETVFLLESVLAAYRRRATIRRDGQDVEVEPLTGLEELVFPEPIGKLEAFYTDGLGSLPITVGERVQNDLYEKTLRYPGHVDGIRFLEQCGLLSPEPVEVAGHAVAPVKLLQKVLEDTLKLGPEGDILVMRVVVEGRFRGAPVAHELELIDYFDAAKGHTAMARTTGFTAACAARRIASGDIDGAGVRFPEEIFLGERFDAIVAELASKGVRIVHRERDIPQSAL
jgi:lysine 6-dehydrogenase